MLSETMKTLGSRAMGEKYNFRPIL